MACKIPIHQKVLLAAQENQVQVLQRIKTSNTDIHWSDCRYIKSGDTPLHIAAKEGNLLVIKFLCEEWVKTGHHIDVSNRDGKKSLHEAAQFSRPNVVQYLISKGVQMNSLKRGDWTPLMLACTKTGPQALETVDILLNNGEDPHLINKDGWTALHLAAREGDSSIVQLLLDYGADCAKIASRNGRSPLHTAAFHNREDVVKLLLKDCPYLLEQVDSSGVHPVMEAVRGGHLKLVRTFLQAGGSLDGVDAVGMGCLHYAAQTACLPMIMFLVKECKHNVNCKTFGSELSPLHFAARANQLAALQLLLRLGAHADACDKNGHTVLDVTHGTYRREIEKLLQIFETKT